MRTTVDIPEKLLRQAKAQAALRGIRLKDLVAEALEKSLFQSGSPSSRPADSENEEETQVLGEDCVFPLIRGACGPALQNLDNEAIGRILDEEEVERALRAG